MKKIMYFFKSASVAACILMSVSCGGGDAKTVSPVSGNASAHAISGTVSGAISDGVTITLSGAATTTTTTSSDGTYTFSGLYDGSYTVTPSLTGYSFNPISTSVAVSGADVSKDFTSTVNAAPTYTLSGTVSGAVSSGVTITITGAASATTTTNPDGTYTIAGLYDGNYTVTPSLTGYIFTPTSTSVTVNGADVTGTNFTSSTPTYSISGKVSGAVSSGVTISITNTATSTTTTTTTSASGTYTVSGLGKGSYTVTPSLTGYTFSPTSISATVSRANVTGRNFTSAASTASTYSISGTVSGAVSSGVTVFVTGTATATTTTGTGGTYTIAGLANGSYTVTPSLTGYAFTPTNTSVTVSGANVTGKNFTSAVSSATSASIRLDTTRYGSDKASISSAPNPAVGVLATGWIKSTHTAGTYSLTMVNQDFWTIRGSNWMIQTVPAAATSSATVAGYTNNIMFFGTAGTSTDIWADDYLLHSDYTVNEATALGWVFCAWHVIVNGSANVVVTQKYRYYASNTFMTDTATIPIATLRSQLNSRSGTTNFNAWVPSNASLSFSLGNGLSVPFDLTRVRIYQTSAMPSDAALLVISNSDTADTAAWADYAFNWVSGSPVLSDRSGNGRNLSTQGTLYQGSAF